MNQIRCIGLAVVLSVAGSIEARGQQEGVPQNSSLIRHVVIEAATAETPRSDTASIAELTDGRLMVVYHKYERGNIAGTTMGCAESGRRSVVTAASRGKTRGCWWMWIRAT